MLRILFISSIAGAATAVSDQCEVVVGNIRVQALSPSLLRVEPKGPGGFENRTTLTVVNRSMTGIPIHLTTSTETQVTLKTASYTVLLQPNSGAALPSCNQPRERTDVSSSQRSPTYPKGASVADRAACCKLCDEDELCSSWVFAPITRMCWPLTSFGALRSARGREFGCRTGGACGLDIAPSVVVLDASGETVYNSSAGDEMARNLLHWPPPLTRKSYSLVDFPRFHAPEWGVAPIPNGTHPEPELLKTHGYDFRNNVNGDRYIFLLGQDLAGWSASRAEFLALTGPVPLLPDYAYGTWFTWWTQYTEKMAKDDISRWESGKLPIDIWALDMNWRRTEHHEDRYYNHPNTDLFPNFTEWFEYLKEHRLRTYFNDHPYPVASRGAGGLQTSAEETAFRWQGLSEWMARGLTFWWFDHNWAFSIPPPFVNTSQTDGSWWGFDNAAWGSHIYYTSVAYFYKTVRDPAGDTFNGGRPMTLTKFAKPDWRPGMDPQQHAEHPSQHRYPVWWTGDGVNLQASVESMVDSGLYDLKPFVHSDCGGDSRGSAVSLLRWTGHCVFGSVTRFHGSDHRPWTYGPDVEDTIRSYLNMRYKLLPSIIAAGHEATLTGFPLVARCDLLWPEHAADSSTNGQYVFLGEVLVAPITDEVTNVTSRSVWIPPGSWHDAWDGSTVTGPKTLKVTQPAQRQPMWHKGGGMLVLAKEPGLRVDEQDWSTLVVEAFPEAGSASSRRSLFERGSSQRTDLELRTDDSGLVQLHITPPAGSETRAWLARFHLRPGQRAQDLLVDGLPVEPVHLKPMASESSPTFVPFAGPGTDPAPLAGPVVEVHVPASSAAHVVGMRIATELAEVVV